MELLLARKNIHYFIINDGSNNPVQFIFTDKMLENDLFIELRETNFEVEIDDDEDQDVEVDYGENEDDDEDETTDDDDEINPSPQTQEFEETTITLSAVIDNTGMDYFMMIEPAVDVSRLTLYRQILDLIEIVDNCPKDKLHAYLQDVAISYFSGKQVKQFNRERNITRDMIKMLGLLRGLRDQKIKDKK